MSREEAYKFFESIFKKSDTKENRRALAILEELRTKEAEEYLRATALIRKLNAKAEEYQKITERVEAKLAKEEETLKQELDEHEAFMRREREKDRETLKFIDEMDKRIAKLKADKKKAPKGFPFPSGEA